MAKKKAADPVGSFNFGANVKPRKSSGKKSTKGGRKSNAWNAYMAGK